MFFHVSPGTCGGITGVLVFGTIGAISYLSKVSLAYNLDPQNVPNAFEPFLVKYLRAAEFIVGLATGSIVLLVGSSALHAQSGHLPWFYASPLILLGQSVLFGVVFMVWLIFSYEDHKHGNAHTKLKYTVSETLGFSSLVCFCLGYFWLIVVVTR